MKLSTKSTYGLRAMVNLARGYDNRAISISDIAKEEGISVSYLEQLLNKLRRSKLVVSQRGPSGGYMLARRPEVITVGDIVRVLEGGTAPVYCVAGKNEPKKACIRTRTCVARSVWESLAKAIDGVLDSVNLKDLAVERAPGYSTFKTYEVAKGDLVGRDGIVSRCKETE